MSATDSAEDVSFGDEVDLRRAHDELVSGSNSENLRVIWKSTHFAADDDFPCRVPVPPSSAASPSKLKNLHSSSKKSQPLGMLAAPKATPSVVSSTMSPLSSPRRDKVCTSGLPKSPFGRVRVIVRCRPLLQTDAAHSTERLYVDRQHVVIRESQTYSGKRFTFDRVLSPEASQQDVFIEVLPLVDHALNGFNATVFAYGQTGSGKTFTMDGLQYVISPNFSADGHLTGDSAILPDTNTPVERHGVLPRVIQMLYDLAAMREAESIDKETGEPKEGAVKYSFKCSFLQIYNEKITDLLQSGGATQATHLDKSKIIKEKKGSGIGKNVRNSSQTPPFGPGLRLRWTKGDVFRVQNLFLCECESPQTMRNAFFKGVKEKVMASHIMNVQSSRSHCIFTIYVTRKDARTGDIVGRAEFSLVDLAGSEKLNAISTDHRTTVAKESIDINTSLLALGKVIVALSNAKGKHLSAHIPYRESNLTKLLKHALGGNSLTTMIACISPSDAHVEESISTLLYAGRAKNIENEPHVNEDPTFAIIRELREEISQLKKELQYYRMLVQNGLIRSEENAKNGSSPPGSSRTEGDINHQSRSRSGGAKGKEEAISVMEKNELADSLISACEMLQHIIGVNSQLRDAYDALKGEGERAGVREMYLNAENLALRDRIEMLESIVLNEEFLKITAGSNGNEAQHVSGTPSRESSSVRSSSELGNEVSQKTRKEEKSSPIEDGEELTVTRRTTGSRKGNVLVPSSTSLPSKRAPNTSLLSSPFTPPPLPPSREPQRSSPLLTEHHRDGTGRPWSVEEENILPKHFSSLQTAGVDPSADAKRGSHRPPPSKGELSQEKGQGNRSHSGTPTGWEERDEKEPASPLRYSREQMHVEKRSSSSFSSVSSSSKDGGVIAKRNRKKPQSTPLGKQEVAPSRPSHTRLSDSLRSTNRAQPSSSTGKTSSSGKKRLVSRGHSRGLTSSAGSGSPYSNQLAHQLAEYDRRYRNPHRASTYADYYGKANGPGGPRPPPSFPTSRSVAGNSSNKSMEVIQFMDNVLQALPREVVKEVVPASLKKSENFGKLSFGGSTKEIEDFQQRRIEREEKLRSLLEKNRELNKMVQNEIASPLIQNRNDELNRYKETSSKRSRDLFSLSFPGVANSKPNRKKVLSRHNRPQDYETRTGSRNGSRNGGMRESLHRLNETVSFYSHSESEGQYHSGASQGPPTSSYPPRKGRLSSVHSDSRHKAAGNVPHYIPAPFSMQGPTTENRYTSHSFDLGDLAEEESGVEMVASDGKYGKNMKYQKYSIRRPETAQYFS